MSARTAALASFLALGVALGSSAGADPISVGPALLELDALWVGGPPAAEGSPLLVRTSGDGVLVVTRAPAGNTPAWRSATRDAYMTEVEKGLLAGAEKLALTRKKLGKDNVNVIDATVRRKGPKGGTEVVAVRILLFRTLTIAAAAAAPDTRAGRKLVETAVAGLSPR